MVEDDSFPYEYIFFISTSDPWYGDILIYLQNLKCHASFSREERCKLCVNAKNYLIIGDTLYRRGVDYIFLRCLNHEETERVLNDFHSGACGGHLAWLATAQIFLSCQLVLAHYLQRLCGSCKALSFHHRL